MQGIFKTGGIFLPKTLFNTTEKSNFILNMKQETVDKTAFFVLAGICILMTISQIPAEFTYGLTDMPFLAIGISTVFAVIIGVIMFLRKRADKSSHIICISLAVFLFLWSLVSYYLSFNLTVSLFGQDGRYDGLITMTGYIFIFFTAMMISHSRIERITDIMISTGLFHSLWSVYQMMYFGKSYYYNLEVIAVKDVKLASGLTGSPFFLAMLMNILLVLALLGVNFTENKKKRIFYAVSSVIFTLTVLQTHVLSAVIGLVLVYISCIIIAVVCKKTDIFNIIVYIIGIAIAVAEFIIGYSFYDGGIAWQDSFYRLGVTGYYSKAAADFDVNNLKEVYSYFWNEAIEGIKKYPFFGTGPDGFTYLQYKTTSLLQYEVNSIDRPYNDYLYLAATRGIPYVTGYVVLLVSAVISGFKNIKNNSEWYFRAFPVCIIVFAVMSIFNDSAVSYMPFVWIIAGFCFTGKVQTKQEK